MLSFSNTSYTGAHVDLTIFIYLMPSLISSAVCGGTACLNGGTCIPTGGTDFNCTCEFGFIGDQCQSKLIIYVFHSQCKNKYAFCCVLSFYHQSQSV